MPVTDLRQYRKNREKARKAQVRAQRGSGEPLLGGRPRAGLILVLVVAVLAAMGALRFLGGRGLAPGPAHAQFSPTK